MKLKRISMLLPVIMLAGLLAACESMPVATTTVTAATTTAAVERDPYEGLIWYEHPVGIALYMTEGFTQGNVENVLACYEGENANVRFAAELFDTLETMGYGDVDTEEEYGALILEAYQLEGSVKKDEYGNVYIAYTQQVEGTPVAYYAFYDKGENAFWTTTFMCLESEAIKYEASFKLWASSIEVGEFVSPEPVPEPLTEEETEELRKIIEKLTPVDYLGKSFVSQELTNEEMLRLSYAVFGAQQYGIVGTNAAYFRDNIADKYFDYPMKAEDMICSCGELLAAYDSENDHYNWEGQFHDYTAHHAEALNLYLESYKADDSYVVTMNKIFPDLNENIHDGTMHFYADYEDARDQTESLFTAENDAEFQNALETLDTIKLKTYTYIFVKDDDRFVLVEYRIGQ